ncbi:MAG: DUF2249 domain-containing protein [Gemmatimonadota bacterium]|nr:DUF2249 domain-containing protein [Gemmatimonadota bacterium]
MTAPTRILQSERLQSVFERDERLIDIIASHSPALARLRNSPMRRIMARVTTVAQAARLCGIPAAQLVDELNAALGFEKSDVSIASADESQSTPEISDQATAPDWTHQMAVELDVRDDLRNGREPFSRIMAAVAQLRPSNVLLLHTTFEPVPLFAVLAKRGFEHHAEQRGAEDWLVWFRQSDSSEPVMEAAVRPIQKSRDPVSEVGLADVVLDVRGLEPPEPMVRTLEALEVLPPTRTLLHVNVRIPQLLLPILRERGFVFEIDDTRVGEVHVRIWHEQTPTVEA